MDNLSEIIKEALLKKGASLVGFADLKDMPVEKTEGFRYGISIAVAVDPVIISGIESGPTKEYYSEYFRLNNLLDEIGEHASDILKSYGFSAVPKTTKVVHQDEDSLSTMLPHKTVATRAGLGWIGKCALLITEEFGAAIRLSTVLTDAKLEVGVPINESRCGNCSECKKYCPGDAIKGVNWNIKLSRDEYYNAFNCSRAARKVSSEIGIKDRICGKCIVVCPWTKKYLNSKRV
jgi:epoxyqueuosine reductase QueG